MTASSKIYNFKAFLAVFLCPVRSVPGLSNVIALPVWLAQNMVNGTQKRDLADLDSVEMQS